MSDPNNKWNQPPAPPAPMFFGKKERDLVKQVNDELAERIIGQPIAYYPISIEESNFNDTYGEAIDKVSLPPIRVYAYVEVENEQTNERYGYEYLTKLTVNFNEKRLTEDQNLFVRVGDFIQYGDQFYEIVKTYNDTRYYFGQVEHKFQISTECIRARQGSFRVLPSIDRKPERGVVAGETTSPAPRTAPTPPLNASYITATPTPGLPKERVLTAGTGITITDAGANGTITVASTTAAAVGPSGSLQFTPGAGTFSGSHSLRFSPSTKLLELTGAMSLLGALTASTMRLSVRSGSLAGSGSYLGLDNNNNIVIARASATGGSSPGGPNYSIQFNDAETLTGSASLTFSASVLTVAGAMTASSTISAFSFYGDGSNLTGITASAVHVADGPVGSLQFRVDTPISGEISGSAKILYEIANNRLSFGGGLVYNRAGVATSYTASTSDHILAITAVPTSLLLDAALFSAGQPLVIKDESGLASAVNTITLNASASQTIDGVSTAYIESPYGSVLLYSNGTNWFVY